jgi:hypothetical protein
MNKHPKKHTLEMCSGGGFGEIWRWTIYSRQRDYSNSLAYLVSRVSNWFLLVLLLM